MQASDHESADICVKKKKHASIFYFLGKALF